MLSNSFAIKGSIHFSPFTSKLSFDFTALQSNTFGNNSTRVDFTPTAFAVYGGDVNKDDAVDLSDITQVYNDANIFLSGYVISDLTGDNFADLSDINLVFNNSGLFVSVIRP